MWRGALANGDCAAYFAGTVQSGDACEDDWDCADPIEICGTLTPTVGGSKTCRARGEINDPCEGEYAPCEPGLYCDEATLECDAGHAERARLAELVLSLAEEGKAALVRDTSSFSQQLSEMPDKAYVLARKFMDRNRANTNLDNIKI